MTIINEEKEYQELKESVTGKINLIEKCKKKKKIVI